MRFVALIACCWASLSPALAAPAGQTKAPTLTDLYLELPLVHLPLYSTADGKPLSPAARKALIKVEDLKNGYLEIANEGVEGMEETAMIALFKRKAAPDLIGVAHVFGDRTEGLVFLEKGAAGWRDVTSEVMPKISYEEVDRRARAKIKTMRADTKLTDCASGTFRYMLPRHGRRIRLVTSSDCVTTPKPVTLMELDFDGARFGLIP